MGLSCSKCGSAVETDHSHDLPASASASARTRRDCKSSGKSSSNNNNSNKKGSKKGKNKTIACTRQDSPDPVVFDLTRRSVALTQQSKVQQIQQQSQSQQESTASAVPKGQHHLLYKQQKGNHAVQAAAALAGAAWNNNNNNTNNNNNNNNNTNTTTVTKTKKTIHYTNPNTNTNHVPAEQQDRTVSAAAKSAQGTTAAATTAESSSTTAADTLVGNKTNVDVDNVEVNVDNLDVDEDLDSFPTRVVVRRHSPRHYEEGLSGTHIYCIRYPASIPLDSKGRELQAAQEQCPGPLHGKSHTNANVNVKQQHQHQHQHQQQHQSSSTAGAATTKQMNRNKNSASSNRDTATTTFATATAALSSPTTTTLSPTTTVPQKDGQQQVMDAMMNTTNEPPNVDQLFRTSAMAAEPAQIVVDWVTISEEHNIYVADVGLDVAECDEIVAVTEQVCRGQYAAYTYAKQTLGCREFPILAAQCQAAVHTVTHAIVEFAANANGDLALDDREPHMVKYDVTKKERQKLDMHTDKSEWTFLIALSNGCGMDYEGGGTYFECLDATLHLQRGHALIFPGKLRHCGQRITAGLRFLLVGFLVDKTAKPAPLTNDDSNGPDAGIAAHLSNYQ